MSTRTRFEKEAKGNSEMAYYFIHSESEMGVNCPKIKVVRTG